MDKEVQERLGKHAAEFLAIRNQNMLHYDIETDQYYLFEIEGERRVKISTVNKPEQNGHTG